MKRYIPQTRQLNYCKAIIRDAETRTGIGKWAITFLGLNLQQEFAQGLKELLKLPHGEPASVSGLLTQEVLIPCGSWVLGRPLDLLGEALTNPISVSFPSCSQKVDAKAVFLRTHGHCLHSKGGKPCISPLASPSTQRAGVTHIRPKRKTLLCFSEQASWAGHQDEPPRKSIRSSNHFFYGDVRLTVLSGTRNLLPSILGKEFWFTAAMKDEEKKKYSRKWKATKVVAQIGNEEIIIAPKMKWTSCNVKGQR